ncbi:hypothetical protein KJ966_28715 [bacterium]|nr:hypothetical protein [bacterium]
MHFFRIKKNYRGENLIRAIFFILLTVFTLPSLIAAESSSISNAIKSIKATNSKDTLLLIGFNTGNSSNDEESYGKMYDNDDSINRLTYQPFTTIGLIRSNRNILLHTAPYLAAPTINGFVYINSLNKRQKLTEEDIDEDLADPEMYKNYKWSVDETRIFITSKKDEIVQTLGKTILNEDALYTYFESIDYITPYFMIKKGYTSEVTFGATWFNATEFIKLESFKTKYSHNLEDFVSQESYREILKNVHKSVYKEYPKGDEPFPWDSDPWYEKKDAKYTLSRKNGVVHLDALIPCWGNSAREFLASYDTGVAPKPLINQHTLPFDLNEIKKMKSDILDAVISPNLSTVYIFTKTQIHGYDTSTGEMMATFDLKDILPNGRAKKIIMVEWALGKYVSKWKNVLIYR